MKLEPPRTEARIAELARAQHGVVTTSQLVSLGLHHVTIRDRAAAGRLHRIHRGVYAVGHPLLSREGHWMAAVLACGTGAVLSHRSAAALWELRASASARTDVTSPTNAGRSTERVRIHRTRSLRPHDVATVDGIPCTSVSRTLLDLADVLNRRQLERVCNQAEVMRVLFSAELEAVLATPGRRATSVLRAVLRSDDRQDTFTRSELEERFLALCRSAGLPQPRVNAWIAFADGEGAEVDFLWARPRIVVETDGRAAHSTRAAFANDRRRDQRLTAAGYRVLRFTWDQVVDEPTRVATTLAQVLAASQPSPTAPALTQP